MLTPQEKTIEYLIQQFSGSGEVKMITYRPERVASPVAVDKIEALESQGLAGDHYKKNGGKRQVTLIQWEHIMAVSSYMNIDELSPLLLRRNIITKGINLLALKGKKFSVGAAVFEYTGECHPCSRMEENLGQGGYNAMRGHGGITCRVLSSGSIAIGDAIVPLV
ncbi:MOSC domain-containing protein [bacterium]|nr:MOSC domain-containing protein [bacterium]